MSVPIFTTPPTVWVSVDIGRRNFAIRAEAVSEGYHPHPLIFDLVDLGSDADGVETQTKRLTAYLQSHAAVFAQAHWLIVEQQRLIRGQITNATSNMRIMQHVFSFFNMHHPQVRCVELSPTVKTQANLWAVPPPPKMTRPQRKQWGLDRAVEILTTRSDFGSLAVLAGSKDKFDLSDTVIQLVAYQSWIALGSPAAPVTKKYNPYKRNFYRKK